MMNESDTSTFTMNHLAIHHRKPSWLAEWTSPLLTGSGLFHRAERPLLIRVVKPSPLPEIAGGRSGGNL